MVGHLGWSTGTSQSLLDAAVPFKDIKIQPTCVFVEMMQNNIFWSKLSKYPNKRNAQSQPSILTFRKLI
jgi:hypothetical protein